MVMVSVKIGYGLSERMTIIIVWFEWLWLSSGGREKEIVHFPLFKNGYGVSDFMSTWLEEYRA